MSEEIFVDGMSEFTFVCLFMIENHNTSPGATGDKINEARRLYNTIIEQFGIKTK